MFLSVAVDEKDRDALRFLWFDEGDYETYLVYTKAWNKQKAYDKKQRLINMFDNEWDERAPWMGVKILKKMQHLFCVQFKIISKSFKVQGQKNTDKTNI